MITYRPYGVQYPAEASAERSQLPVRAALPAAYYPDTSRGETKVYLMPIDPPRSREIAQSTGTDFIVNFWWKERSGNLPFGVLPETVTLIGRDGEQHRRAVYEGVQLLGGFSNLSSALGNADYTEFKRLPDTWARAYRITSTVPKDMLYRSLFLPSGRLFAQDFQRVVVVPFQGMWGSPPATSGLERTFYDTRFSFQYPTISVTGGSFTSAFTLQEVMLDRLRFELNNPVAEAPWSELRRRLPSDFAHFSDAQLLDSLNFVISSFELEGSADFVRGSKLGLEGIQDKGIVALKNRLFLTRCCSEIFRNDPGRIFRMTASVTLSKKPLEETVIDYLQAEALGRNAVRRYVATFRSGQLENEQRQNVGSITEDADFWRLIETAGGSLAGVWIVGAALGLLRRRGRA